LGSSEPTDGPPSTAPKTAVADRPEAEKAPPPKDKSERSAFLRELPILILIAFAWRSS
jgi:hypothetical protein